MPLTRAQNIGKRIHAKVLKSEPKMQVNCLLICPTLAWAKQSVIARQCLRRRIADKFTLATEWIAWECPRNEACVTIRWKFTKQDARRVFAKYYPDSQFHNVGALVHH